MTAPAGGTGDRPSGGVTAGDNLKGRYRLLHRLVANPRTDLWTARDEILDRTVLVKLLHLETGDLTVRERFRSEATAVARLSHPGILAVYDTLLEAGVTGLVLEHVEATPLSRYLHEGGPISSEQALSIALQVADALAVAHDLGIRHCNLSTDVVWLCGDGRIKITDFGTAWAHGGTASAGPSIPAWGQEQADIRALAGLLRDCLVPAGAEDLPEGLASFIAQAESDQAERPFGSVVEARAFLAAARGASPPPDLPQIEFPARAAEPPSADPEPVPRPVTRPRRISRALAVGLLGAAVAAAVVVPALTGDDPPAADPPPPLPPVVTTRAPDVTVTADQPPPAAVAPDESQEDEGQDEGQAATVASGDESPAAETAEPTPSADPGVAIVSVQAITFSRAATGGDDPDALRVLDGDTATFWATPGLSAGDRTIGGVGLEFQLAEPTVVSQLAVTSDTLGWEAAVFVGAGGHDRLSDWGPLVDQQVNVTGHTVFGLADQRASAVLLWIPDPRAALTEEIRIAEAIISAEPAPTVR
ncbi:MAG: protein kinase [bacterium]|nr:protein kinase [bacterium]